MTLIHVSGPATLPVSLPELRMHARIDVDTEDTLLEAYMLSALEDIERRLGVVYLPQVWQWVGDAFPTTDYIDLGIGPVSEVATLTYLDEDGLEQTVDDADYTLDTARTPGRIYRVGDEWPVASAGVTVTFTAGRGTVPPSVQQAIRLMVADAYGDRESGGDMKPSATALVSSHRRIVF